MDSRYNQYFQSLLGKKGQQFDQAPAISQPPPLQNYFSSENVLGNPNAQNSAQRAEAGVNSMSQAYGAVMGNISATQDMIYNATTRPATAAESIMHQADEKGRVPLDIDTSNQGLRSIGAGPVQFLAYGGGSRGKDKKDAPTPQTSTANVAKFGEAPRKATELETHLAQIRGQKGETMGNADDRARWEADAYRAKAIADAEAQKKTK